MYTKELTQATGRTARITIVRDETGWKASVEQDKRIVETVHYTDWHRVERAIEVFSLEHAADRESAS